MPAVNWNCLPTCIGSLPFTDEKEAVDLVLAQLSSIPFWPQLPKKGFRENMYAQYAYHLPGIDLDHEGQKITINADDSQLESFYLEVLAENMEHFDYPEDFFSGFHEFMGRDLPEDICAVKGQITGPVSEGLQILDQGGKPVLYDDTYNEVVRKNLNMMARWQEERLKEKLDRTIVFIDEPYLSLMGTPFASIPEQAAISWMNDVMDGLEGLVGAHCCGNTDWPTVMATGIDILSFDAYEYGHTIALYAEEVSEFLDRGGALAWGFIPNTIDSLQGENVQSLVKDAREHFKSLAEKGIDLDLIIKNSLITPQCGLAEVEEATSVRILEMLNQVSERIRTEYSLED